MPKPRRNHQRQQKKHNNTQQPKEQRAHRDAVALARPPCPSTHATDVRPAHRRCRRAIRPSHTPRCRPEPSCHRRFCACASTTALPQITVVLFCTWPADVHASKQNEDVPRHISLHLHRTEEARRVMHLLAGGDKDIFPHIAAIPRGLAQCANRQQKRQERNGSVRRLSNFSPEVQKIVPGRLTT